MAASHDSGGRGASRQYAGFTATVAVTALPHHGRSPRSDHESRRRSPVQDTLAHVRPGAPQGAPLAGGRAVLEGDARRPRSGHEDEDCARELQAEVAFRREPRTKPRDLWRKALDRGGNRGSLLDAFASCPDRRLVARNPVPGPDEREHEEHDDGQHGSRAPERSAGELSAEITEQHHERSPERGAESVVDEKYRYRMRTEPAMKGTSARAKPTNLPRKTDLPPCRAKKASALSTCSAPSPNRAPWRSSHGRPRRLPIS